MVSPGDSFLLPKPNQESEHLWIVVTRPDPQTNQSIIVNLTTQRSHSDTTTILNVGDHPFIKRPSVIFYDDARLCDAGHLGDPSIATRRRQPFSASVLARIQEGILKSKRTPLKIKKAYEAFARAGLNL